MKRERIPLPRLRDAPTLIGYASSGPIGIHVRAWSMRPLAGGERRSILDAIAPTTTDVVARGGGAHGIAWAIADVLMADARIARVAIDVVAVDREDT